MVKLIRAILGILTISLITSCAQVVAPTGGERDRKAPEILELLPENRTTNFTSQTFQLEFDEFVVLKDLNDQLLVSPPLKYKLENKTKGKKVIFTIKDTLLPNTTYVLNFGNSIIDLNEGNPLKNFQYIFSTGSALDSLNLNGRVVDAFDLTANKEAIVLLYPENIADSAIAKELPTYLSRTNKEGLFSFTNLKAGNYRVFAINDKNDNYKYDRPDEKMGFLNEPIKLIESKSELKILSFEKEAVKQFIKEEKVTERKLSLTFNVVPQKLNFSLLDTTIKNFIKFVEKESETIHFWLKDIPPTKIRMLIMDGKFKDTIQFRTDSIITKEVVSLKSKLVDKQNYFEPVTLNFNQVIRKIDKNKITLLDYDSSSIPFKISMDPISRMRVLLEFDITDEMDYTFTALPNAFKSGYSETNDTLLIPISFNSERDFGNLIVKIRGLNSSNSILQLTNTKGEILEEIFKADTVYNFPNLKAGNYGLKLISDDNKNKKWDSGDYYQKRQAEKVVIYNEAVGIRKNWDKEIIWIIK